MGENSADRRARIDGGFFLMAGSVPTAWPFSFQNWSPVQVRLAGVGPATMILEIITHLLSISRISNWTFNNIVA